MERRIIIVGGGNRGMSFVRLLEHELKRPVAAIAESNLESHPAILKQLAEWGIQGIKLFGSLDQTLAEIPRSEADIVFIMTPDWTHLEIARKVIGAGCSVFLEKPVETTRAKVLEILKLARSSDKLVQVGFVLRYSAFVRKVKEIVDSGTLGELVMIQMNERLSLQHGGHFYRSWHRKVANTGGFLNEKCSHDLDLMCWFKSAQAEPVEVFSYGGRHFAPPKDTPETCGGCKLPYCPWRKDDAKCIFHSDGDIMDHQCVNIRFTDGAQGVFTTVAISPVPGRDIRIFGTDGYLEGSLEEGRLRVDHYWETSGLKDVPLGATDGHGGGDSRIIAEFLDCVDRHEYPLSTVADGVQASLIAMAAERSVEKRAAVSLVNDIKMLASARKQDAQAQGRRRRLTGEGFDGNLVVKGAKARNGFDFIVANPSAWPLEVTLTLASASLDVAKDKTPILNGMARFALGAHESKECRLPGRSSALLGASAVVASDKAGELKLMALDKAELHGRLDLLADAELATFVDATRFERPPAALREHAKALKAAMDRGDFLAVANMTSGYAMAQLEKSLTFISAERREAPVPSRLAIACGRETPFVDKAGREWVVPQPWFDGLMPWGCVGGSQIQRGDIPIVGAKDPTIYQNEQYGMRGYRFRVPDGDYNVRLHFAETWHGLAGSRRFDVSAQGETVLKDLDVFAEAGGKGKPLVKEFVVKVKDGTLEVDFTAAAMVNGVEVERL